MEEETEDERGGFLRLIFKYKRTCTNRIASRHCAPVFTVIVTGSEPLRGTTVFLRYAGTRKRMRSEIKTGECEGNASLSRTTPSSFTGALKLGHCILYDLHDASKTKSVLHNTQINT